LAGYYLYRDGALVATLDAATTGYTDTGLDDAHTYHYTVVAFDTAGNQATPSADTAVSTPDVTDPSTPTNFVATGGRKQAVLRWTASTDNSGTVAYTISRDGQFLRTVPGTTTTITDTGLADLTTYSYSILAMDPTGNPSGIASASTKTLDATAPTAPTNLATSLSGTTVKLTWTASSDNLAVKSYTIFRAGTSIGTSTTPSYSDAGAPQGKTASYTVKATDAAGNLSATSNTATAKVPDKTAPSAPTLFKATPGSKKITLTWKASTDNIAVTGYFLNRGTTRIATLGAAALTYTNTGLTTNTTYTYKLIAFDAAGNQSTAATITAKAK
jgi:chitodextrinase